MGLTNRIRYLLPVAIGLMITFYFSRCSNLNLNSTPSYLLPAINGFNSASAIETNNLIAYWSFDGNFNESQQKLTPTASSPAPTFVTGIKGQAYQGNGNTYVTYPLDTLNALSLTVSIWFNQAAAPIANSTSNYIPGQGAQGMLMVFSDSTYQVLDFDNELFTTKQGHDLLAFNAGFESWVSTPTKKDSMVTAMQQGYFTNATGFWTQLVMTYDATSSKYSLYQNGQLVGVAAGANPFTVLTGTAGLASTSTLGNLKFRRIKGLIIGAFPQVLNLPAFNLLPQPMYGNFQGALDEIRIYNVALSAIEVTSLYQLEFAGR